MYCNCFRNPDAKETDRLRAELHILEQEYSDQPTFQRRRDLVLINHIRRQLDMPLVDENLQPILTEVVEPIPLPVQSLPPLPVMTSEQRDKLRGLVLSYAVSLNLTMPNLASRIREYLKVNQPLNTLTDDQLRQLADALKQELDALLIGHDLQREYYSTDNGKRVGFILETIQRITCDMCGRGFPLEGSSWQPGSVPFISGGLVFMIDEKGAALLYHGYEGQGQSCYGKAIRAFTTKE